MEINARLIEAGGETDIEKAVDKAVEMNDSIGGLVECTVKNFPVGLGEPFFDSVESALSHHGLCHTRYQRALNSDPVLQLPECEGRNIMIILSTNPEKPKQIMQVALTAGYPTGTILFSGSLIKPASSTSLSQRTMNMKSGKMEDLLIEGRHDKCIALRVPPVLEAAAAIVMADLMLLEQKIKRVNT